MTAPLPDTIAMDRYDRAFFAGVIAGDYAQARIRELPETTSATGHDEVVAFFWLLVGARLVSDLTDLSITIMREPRTNNTAQQEPDGETGRGARLQELFLHGAATRALHRPEPQPPSGQMAFEEREAFDEQRAALFEQYRAACAAIALLSLKELATALKEAFPDAEILVLRDAEPGDHLGFECAEDSTGQIAADSEQVEAAGIDADTIASNLGNYDIGRVTWLRYAPYDRRGNVYRCRIRQVIDLPDDLLTIPAMRDLTRLRTRLRELETYLARVTSLNPTADEHE
jgi:hypothetical protein